MNPPSFKAAVEQSLGHPVIKADRYHYCRYMYWTIDDVQRKVQKEWHAYELKEAYCEWFDWAKSTKDVAEAQIRAFLKAIKIF